MRQVAIITIVLLRQQTKIDEYREKVATIDSYLRRRKARRLVAYSSPPPRAHSPRPTAPLLATPHRVLGDAHGLAGAPLAAPRRARLL